MEPDSSAIQKRQYKDEKRDSGYISNNGVLINEMDCPTHSTLQGRKIDSQNNAPLHKIYHEFETMKFDPKKRRKHMGTYEPIFQHMYKNLKNHSEDKKTFDIFSTAKSVMEKEFHEDLQAGKTQIFVKHNIIID